MEMLTDPLYGDINTGRSAIVLACFYLFIFLPLSLRSYYTYYEPDEEAKAVRSKSVGNRNSFKHIKAGGGRLV